MMLIWKKDTFTLEAKKQEKTWGRAEIAFAVHLVYNVVRTQHNNSLQLVKLSVPTTKINYPEQPCHAFGVSIEKHIPYLCGIWSSSVLSHKSPPAGDKYGPKLQVLRQCETLIECNAVLSRWLYITNIRPGCQLNSQSQVFFQCTGLYIPWTSVSFLSRTSVVACQRMYVMT